MTDVAVYAAVLVSVFAIVDPVGALPFFVALTDGLSDADRQVVRRRAVIVLGTVLALFALLGRFLFAVFGFTLGAFEIAGGILLFLVAFDMLQGEMTRTKFGPQDHDAAVARRDEIAVVPLGIPLLAGPGAISTVMIYEGSAGSDPWIVVATFVAILVTACATLVVLKFGHPILARLGRTGVMAMTRVLGLILAALGVQFVLNGIASVLPHV
jgi:multiple antibiotic resistance protein